MDSKIICKWLEIEAWPPDHHALLGLKPGEADVMRIERQVHERMAMLRCFQLSHPEEATEGMNRVAQAFICLTDTLANPRQRGNGPAANEAPSATSAETQQLITAGNETHVDWKNKPPPVRLGK